MKRCLPEELLSLLKTIPPLSKEAYLWHLFYVPEKYLLVSGDGCRPVIIYKLIQRIELHHPEEILSGSVSEHLEVLHVISKPGEGQGTHRRPGQGALSWLSPRATCPPRRQSSSQPRDQGHSRAGLLAGGRGCPRSPETLP